MKIPFRVRRDVRAVDQDFSLDAGIVGQQAHDRLAQRAFAAAGLSDDGKHFAGLQGKVHAPYRLHRPARGVIADMKILKL